MARVRQAVFVSFALLTACGSPPCVSSTCADTLLVNVVDSAGVTISEFEATFNDITITCSTAKKDPRCTAYGFALAGSPASLEVTVINLRTGASTTVTLTPDYAPITLGGGDCESSCSTGNETVTSRG